MPTSDELTVIATIRDEMSAGIAKIREEVSALSASVDAQRSSIRSHTTATAGWSKSLDGTSKTFSNLSRITSGPLSGRLSSLSTRMQQLSQTPLAGKLSAVGAAGQKLNEQLDLHGKMQTLSSDVTGLVSDLGKLALGFSAAGVAATAFGLKQVAALQQTQLGLSTLTGSPQVGKQLMQGIMGQSSIFSPTTLSQQAVSMLNQGTPANVVNQRLKSLENIAAVQADPTTALNSLVAGINSIQHTGQITTEGMDSLAAAGLPMYDLLSSELGVSKLQVSQLVGQNRISPQMVLNQITSLSGSPYLTRFQGGMGQALNTVGGQMSLLRNSVTKQLAAASTPLAGALQQAMPGVQRVVGQLVGMVAPAGVKILSSLIGPLSKELPRALSQLQPIMPKISASMGQLATGLVKLLPSLVRLAADVLPILPAMVNLATDLVPVISGMVKLVTAVGPLRDLLGGVLLALLAWNKVEGVVNVVRALSSALSTLAEKLALVKTEETAGGAGGAAAATESETATAAEEAGGGATAAAAGGGLPWLALGAGTAYMANRDKTIAAKHRNGVGALAEMGLLVSDPVHAFTGGLGTLGRDLHLTGGHRAHPAAVMTAAAPASSSSSAAQQAAVAALLTGTSHAGAPVTVHQTNTFTGVGLTQQQITDAVARANRQAFERGASTAAAQPVTYAMGRTGSRG